MAHALRKREIHTEFQLVNRNRLRDVHINGRTLKHN